MIRTSHRFALLTVGLALLAAGCQSVSTDPPGAYADPVTRANYPRVVLLDGLQPWIVVSEPIVTKGIDTPLRVSVPVRAVTKVQELNAQYRFAFYDADGRPIEPAPSWTYIRLPSKAQRTVEANALDQRAVDWRVELRPAR